MLTAIGVLLLLSAIGNATWAAGGGKYKTPPRVCAGDAVLGTLLATYLLIVGLGT